MLKSARRLFVVVLVFFFQNSEKLSLSKMLKRVVAYLTCMKVVSPATVGTVQSAVLGDVQALWRYKQKRIFSVTKHDLDVKPSEDRGESTIICWVKGGFFVGFGFVLVFLSLVFCLLGGFFVLFRLSRLP